MWLLVDRGVETLRSSPLSVLYQNTRAAILSAVSEAVLKVVEGIGRSSLLTELLIKLR